MHWNEQQGWVPLAQRWGAAPPSISDHGPSLLEALSVLPAVPAWNSNPLLFAASSPRVFCSVNRPGYHPHFTDEEDEVQGVD